MGEVSCDAACSLVGDAPLTLQRGRASWREGELKLSVCECTKLLETLCEGAAGAEGLGVRK